MVYTEGNEDCSLLSGSRVGKELGQHCLKGVR